MSQLLFFRTPGTLRSRDLMVCSINKQLSFKKKTSHFNRMGSGYVTEMNNAVMKMKRIDQFDYAFRPRNLQLQIRI